VPIDQELRVELLRRAEQDQRTRHALDRFLAASPDGRMAGTDPEEGRAIDRLGEIDAANTGWLRAIVESRGWPTRSLVGEDGARAAWLLAQHADEDPDFQLRCLELMSCADPAEVDAVNLAYLTDRVQLALGQEQTFGTQMEWRRREVAA